MRQRAIIFTTSKGTWIEKNLPFILEQLNKTKGRTVESIDVQTVYPISPLTFKDSDGDTRISWDWFEKHFTEQSDGYSVVIFHFTEYYKKKWNLSKHIGGTYRNDSDCIMEFWLCADNKDNAEGYDFDQFTRRMFHEWSHGDSYFAGLPENSGGVHFWDYRLKNIHELPEIVNYTLYNLHKKVKDGSRFKCIR